ncbi:hypothetical protein K8O92_10230 [Nocardia asteroides]|nr:hypothetical protein K8O92_10230 [Nocardia asteroides]
MAELAALLTAAPEYAEQVVVTQMGLYPQISDPDATNWIPHDVHRKLARWAYIELPRYARSAQLINK